MDTGTHNDIIHEEIIEYDTATESCYDITICVSSYETESEVSSALYSSTYENASNKRVLYFPKKTLSQHSGSLPKYHRIRCNQYINVPKPRSPTPFPCECSPSSLCGEGCLNRIAMIECSPGVCPCGVKCTNLRFQLPRTLKFKVFETKGKGWGLKCTSNIKQNQFITEYVGEVITIDSAQRRLAKLIRQSAPVYFLYLGNGLVIDARVYGSQSRFINHSCNPNCRVEVWTVDNEQRVGIFAEKDISAGEELCFNYKFSSSHFMDYFQCFCGSLGCLGSVAKKKDNTQIYLDLLPEPLSFISRLEDSLRQTLVEVGDFPNRKRLPFLVRNLKSGAKFLNLSLLSKGKTYLERLPKKSAFINE
ncbi:hypothetical protein P9112_005773 [Eukaryota sp. TZLM1-RC]